jgi:acetyl esterase/lipase
MPLTQERYGDHEDQHGELTLPDGLPADGAPLPVAVLVHGGFWMKSMATLDRMRALAADLAGRGWAAWNVEYRRLGGDGGWPQSLDDVSAAVDHLRALRDAGAPLDLGRVVAVGHSAGAHLALLDAAREPAQAGVRVAAVVAQAPLTDVLVAHAAGDQGRQITEGFMGGGPDERADAYRHASPLHRVPLGVPQLVVHGHQDELIPAAMVTAYVDAATAAGDEVTLHSRPENGHFDLIEPGTASWTATLAWLDELPALRAA